MVASKMPLTLKRFLCLATLLAMLAPACAKEPPVRIQCEMSIPRSLRSGEPAELVFTLANAGDEVLQVLNWQTPFEGIKAPMFTVKRNGIEVEYGGRMVKRSAPRKDDYLVVKPGERREVAVDLAGAWNVEPAGDYTVEYSAQLFDVIAGQAPAPRSLDKFTEVTPSCNPVAFTRMR